MFYIAATIAAVAIAAPPAPRIAVLLDDPAPSAPTRASIEVRLQKQGYEVVAPSVAEKLRKVVAPGDLLGTRLPEGLSVFEADAILAGAASYGTPQALEGVMTAPVSLTARLIDLGTGRTTTTIQTSGRGIGIAGPALLARGAEQAVAALFNDKRFKAALDDLGQESGRVTLIVQGVPDRDTLLELKSGLERVLAGAPVKEIYFAKGLGKLSLGGSRAKSMVGPDIADVIGENQHLALVVDEVANTRIVARFDRSRTVNVHALVLQPTVPKRLSKRTQNLGKYVATKMATYDFARASYQAGKLTRAQAMERAKSIGADVIVESEIVGARSSAALSIRVIDVKTGRPIYREQQMLGRREDALQVADAMIATIGKTLPGELTKRSIGTLVVPSVSAGEATADLKELKE